MSGGEAVGMSRETSGGSGRPQTRTHTRTRTCYYACAMPTPCEYTMHVYRAGVVAGAVMTTYLLEKSRVVFQGPNERNYHALYMLQQGADPAERAALCLERSCADYAFLSSSGCYANPEWGDDAEEYRTMRTAMSSIGLAPQAWRMAHAHAHAHGTCTCMACAWHMHMHTHGHARATAFASQA